MREIPKGWFVSEAGQNHRIHICFIINLLLFNKSILFI